MRPELSGWLRRTLDVTLYFASHLCAALLLALPVTALVTGSGIGRYPDGDRLLFEPGGLLLTEVLRLLAPAASSQTSALSTSFVVLGVLLLVPHAALLVRLADEDCPRGRAFGVAAGHLPALLVLSGAALVAQILVVLGASTLGAWLEAALSGATERAGDLAYLALLAVGALLALAIGVARDLGRAALVLESLDGRAALAAAVARFTNAPGRALANWAARALVALALVALGALATQAIDVGRPGAWRVAAVALLHQLVAYALCWCRASWLASSLRLAAATRA